VCFLNLITDCPFYYPTYDILIGRHVIKIYISLLYTNTHTHTHIYIYIYIHIYIYMYINVDMLSSWKIEVEY